jgi:hypothetical protein
MSGGSANAALTSNALTSNFLTANSLTSNALTSNALTSNALNANAVTPGQPDQKKGSRTAIDELNGVSILGVTIR